MPSSGGFHVPCKLGTKVKIVAPQKAKLMNIYKNTKHKLLKTNAAIWFNTKTGVAYK
jgi:hypothetical protein